MRPERVIDIRWSDLAGAWSGLTTAEEQARLDAAKGGPAHFLFAEFLQLAGVIWSERAGSLRHGVGVVALTGWACCALAQRSDFLGTLIDFGIEIVLDTCVPHSPMIFPCTKVIMTN